MPVGFPHADLRQAIFDSRPARPVSRGKEPARLALSHTVTTGLATRPIRGPQDHFLIFDLMPQCNT
jgi:hypothetical protein